MALDRLRNNKICGLGTTSIENDAVDVSDYHRNESI